MKFFKFVLLLCVSFLFLMGCEKESRYEIVTGTVVGDVGTVFVLDKEEGRVWQRTGNNWTYTNLEGVAKFKKLEAIARYNIHSKFCKSKNDVNVEKPDKSGRKLIPIDISGFPDLNLIPEAIKRMHFVDRNFNGLDISTNTKTKK